jgi:hypothetical protein
MAIQPGRYLIPGASAEVNGKRIRSNDGMVEVIAKEKAVLQPYKEFAGVNEDYFLRPGEDPQEKIRKNLFLKVTVDRKTCYVGEPVQALFQLYSRLESWSDIVKNPGFYGFTVYDLLNLSHKQVATEIINGKPFDVHTIRKVLLYPLQAGTFTIDPMEVKNKVEFSRSAVSKKTEQEIVEGILTDSDPAMPKEGTEMFESSLSTEAVHIVVKPLPEKNKPALFSGAVGRFTLTASLVTTELSKNEEGVLEITVEGKGNFIQLGPPAVEWPEGVEGFEPVTKDIPSGGTASPPAKRVFRYPFVGTRPGAFEIPGVSFSFFDTDSNTYKTITTNPLRVFVKKEEKIIPVAEGKKESYATAGARAGRIGAAIVVGLALVIVGYWVFQKKKAAPLPDPPAPVIPSVKETLESARLPVQREAPAFYRELQQCIWKYLNYHIPLEGSGMNKDLLVTALLDQQIAPSVIQKLEDILRVCETGSYTGVSMEISREELLEQTGEVLEHIRASLL